MTAPRDWRSYPPSFATLVEEASLRPIRIQCGTEGKAKSLVGRLQQFVGVLHKNASLDKELLPLDAKARRVKITFSGTELVAIPRDLEEDNLLILRGLGQAPLETKGAEGGETVMSPEMRKMFDEALTNPPTGL